MLGLFFINEPLVKEINLVDPSFEVMESLKKKLFDSYITMSKKLKLHHKKGQDLILGTNSKTIFIAGMGGKEIGEMLIHFEDQLTERDSVVISPHRNILELRELLHHSSFNLKDEQCLKEEGQFYQMLCLTKAKNAKKVPLYGDNIWQGGVGEEYRQGQLKHFKLHKDQRSQAYVDFLSRLNS